MDHVPSNALRVFYISRYRVKEVPALSLSSVTNAREKEDAMMITWTYSMTRYFSPGKSKTSSNWMMLGWSIAVKMEISLSIMCSFPWHLACNRENASLYDIWKDFEWRKQNKCEMHSRSAKCTIVQFYLYRSFFLQIEYLTNVLMTNSLEILAVFYKKKTVESKLKTESQYMSS